MKRALSWSAAQACEDATQPRCQCRCRGALHGARRGRVVALPFEDPHSPTTVCPTCRGTGLQWGRQTCRPCGGRGRVFVGSVPAEELHAGHVPADVTPAPAEPRPGRLPL